MSLLRVHVFLMDTGSMYQVEASLSNKVGFLKESISKITKIPADQQVLLISGGAPLFDEKQLYKYESVSDNTVFLICKSTIQDINRPPSTSKYYSEPELQSQLQTALNLPSTKETVRARMYLAQQICDIDQHELEDIELMVYEQHLQQQGWACVVANLEDVSSGFGNRAAVFQMELVDFLKIREDILALLRRMPTVMTLLGKIPIVPSLEQEASNISTSQRGLLDKDCPFTPGQQTLYNWMNCQDSKHRLEDVIKDVSTGTDQLGYPLEESVQQEVQTVCRSVAANKALWVIKGLEDRLSGLDKLTRNAKSMVDMQVQTRKGFKLNWQRLEIEKDNSILPDLCATHKNQLLELHTRHRKLKELRNKCTAAKQELSKTIQDRLPWMMQTHQNINAMNNTLWLHHDLLKRIRSRASFLNQVEMAPQVYATMLVEVVRRRNFSREFLKWSTGVAEESKKEHRREIHRRRAFTKKCGSHFLQMLFIGFKDHVPKFATEAPKNVDIDLPGVTTADIDYLSKEVPELQQMLRLDLGSPALGVSFQQSCGPGDVSVTDPFLLDTGHFMGTSSSSSTSFVTTTTHSLTQPQDSPLHHPGPLLMGVGAGERERLSLSCQAEGGERVKGGEGGAGKGDDPHMFRSLQCGLLPVPQCLSETLTAEVNSAAMSTISVSLMSASPQSQEFTSAVEYLAQQPLQQQQQQQQQPQQQQQQQQQQHQQQQRQQQPPPPPPPQAQAQAQAPQEGAGGDGVLLSSGDLEPATKSSDSDVSEHNKAPRCRRKQQHQHRGSAKGLLSDTSPDAETSQEFANTDFYIEDSMPSSITDSPPKTGAGFPGGGAATSKKGQVISAALAEKAKRVDELEGEVSALQSRLAGSQEKLASLGTSMSSEVVGLRESLGALRESVQQGDGRRREKLLGAQEMVRKLFAAVREEEDREREEAVRREREGGRQTAEELEARYREKCQATKDLEQSMVRVTSCITDLNHELQAQRQASQREMSRTREQHLQEVEEVKRQTVLEVELETDRLRAEMQVTQDALEGQVLQLQEDLHQTRQQLELVVSDKDSGAATLKQQFEDERRQLQASMEAERSQAVEQVRQAVRVEAEKEATSLLKKESQQNKAALTHLLEKMNGKHQRRLAEQESELTARHQAELNSVCGAWSDRRFIQEAAKEADLTTEFELKHEALRKETDSVWAGRLASQEAELTTEFELKHEALRKEMDSVWAGRLASQEAELTTDFELKHEALRKEMCQEWAGRLGSQEAELTTEFELKHEALRKEMDSVCQEWAGRLASQEAELTTEFELKHEALRKEMCQEWAGRLGSQEADLTTEFELKHEALRKEMDSVCQEWAGRLASQEAELTTEFELKHEALRKEMDSVCQEWAGRLASQEAELTTEFELKHEALRKEMCQEWAGRLGSQEADLTTEFELKHEALRKETDSVWAGRLASQEADLTTEFELKHEALRKETDSVWAGRLASQEAELTTEFELKHEALRKEMDSVWAGRLASQEAELTTEFELKHEALRKETDSVWAGRLASQEAELTTEFELKHEALRKEMCQEWAGRLASQEAELTTEFELKHEALRKEMGATTPELREAASQSEDVSAIEKCTQSEASSFSDGADVAVQSEGRDCGVQWEDGDGVVGVGEEAATQTPPPPPLPATTTEEQSVQCDRQGQQQPPSTCDRDMQSEGPCLAHQATQSHQPPSSVCEQGVQSDASALREQGVQSDTSALKEQGVQSDSCCVLNQSVQSDSCYASETSGSAAEGQDAVSMEQHQQLVAQTVEQTREQLTQQYEQMLAVERERAEQRMQDVEEQHRKEKEDALSSCKSAVLAERQINFNEAIASAVKSKDSLIEELTAKLNELTSRGEDAAVEAEAESGDIRKQLASIKEKETHLKGEKQRLENEVLMLQQQLHQYSEQFHNMTASAAPLSPFPADPNPMTHSSESAMARSTCSVPMETSMTSSVRREAQGKVSILTCNVGDLVLLCLDERHDQYVVFTVGTTLHFLHSDCIDLLGLRPGEGEPRKNWVLAEVTEREYCQARKAQNRFKVPVNTKFYRVKAKPWMPKTSSTSS